MIINLDDYSPNSVYHLMTQSLIPRPIAWVLTQNNDGETHNLAPFSYFTAVSSNPPLIMFSAMAKASDGTPKDTVSNILREKQFVVHIATAEQIDSVQQTAAPLPYGESELAASQLKLCDFEKTGHQRLVDAPIAMACELYQQQSIGDAAQTLIFGKIIQLYIDDSVVNVDNQRISIDPAAVSPLARLGAGQFADITHIRRPKSN